MKCGQCDAEHALTDLEPSFRRPEDVVNLPQEVRERWVQEDDDLCRINGGGEAPDRYFVRCTLRVPLTDAGGSFNWGVWAEVDEPVFNRVLELWTDPDQASEPAMPARLANPVPCSPDTMGLPVELKLTSPKTRAALSFTPEPDHPFADECRKGVSVHRLIEWLEEMG
jgi:hypothetical protein